MRCAAPDYTTQCFLEQFQVPDTMQAADRVLKQLGSQLAAEHFKVRYCCALAMRRNGETGALFFGLAGSRWEEHPGGGSLLR